MDKPRAFIFDMDGTLVDNTRFHLQAWLQLLADLGREVVAAEFHHWSSGKTNGQILRHVLGPGFSDGQIADLAERKEALYRAAYGPHRKLVPGLDRFLREATHHGVPMAVASSAGRANIEFVLDGLGIMSLFEAIVSGEDVRNGKPDPEVFQLAARRLGVDSKQCLVFEDSLAGIEAAARAGMKAVAITTSFGARVFASLPGTVLVVQDFTSLHPESLVDPARESQRQQTLKRSRMGG